MQDLADRMNVSNLDLVLSENSRKKEIQQELRIEAIKAAKAKAESLMSAIGSKVGKAIYVKDVDEEKRRYSYNTNMNAANAAYRAANMAVSSGYDSPLSFAPEKVRSVVLVRFEIE